MKKKTPDSGVWFGEEIGLREKREDQRQDRRGEDAGAFQMQMRFVLLFLLIFSMLMGLQRPLDLGGNVFVFAAGAALETVLFFLLFSSEKRKAVWLLAGAGVYLLLFAVLGRFLWSGIQGLADSIWKQYNHYSGNQSLLSFAEEAGAWERGAALIYLTLPVSALAAKGTVRSSRVEFLLPSLLVMPGIPMAVGKMPELLWGSLFLLCFLFAAATQRRETDQEEVRETEEKARMQSDRRLAVSLGICGLAFAWLAVPFLRENFGDWKVETRQALQRRMAETDILQRLEGNLTDWLPWELKNEGGMSLGRLGGADRLEYSEEEHLQITVYSENSPSGYLYLKGYAGGKYTGRGWSRFPEGEALSGVYLGRPGTVCRLGAEWSDGLLSSLSASGEQPVEARILPTGADSSCAYAPEGVLAEESLLTAEQDLYWTGGNGQIVYYPMLPLPEVLEEELLEMYALRAGILAEAGGGMGGEEAARYEQEVRALYTEVPEELEKLKNWMGDVKKEDFPSLGTAIEYVRGKLWGQAEYSLEPGRTPGGEDFVEYFLFTQKKGYCVYFSSAAVMMFRSMGIPARYAEGYLVNLSGGKEQISVKDSCSHAWTEIFLEGLGWFPVEVTPGFAGAAGMEVLPEPESESPGETESREELEESTEAEPETERNDVPEGAEETLPAPESHQPAEKMEENGGENSRALRIAGMTAAVVLALGTALAFRRGAVVRRRKRKLHPRPGNPGRKAVLSGYREFCRLTAWLGKPLNVETKAEEAAGKYSFLGKGEYERYRKLAEEAMFSRHPATAEQAEWAAGFYEEFRRKAEKNLSVWKRLWMKYWKCF